MTQFKNVISVYTIILLSAFMSNRINKAWLERQKNLGQTTIAKITQWMYYQIYLCYFFDWNQKLYSFSIFHFIINFMFLHHDKLIYHISKILTIKWTFTPTKLSLEGYQRKINLQCTSILGIQGTIKMHKLGD